MRGRELERARRSKSALSMLCFIYNSDTLLCPGSNRGEIREMDERWCLCAVEIKD